MRFIQYLNEAYFNRVTMKSFICKGSYEVFKNPTKKEVTEICLKSNRSCRFVIDVDHKDVYMWDPDMLHLYVAQEFNWKYPAGDNSFIWGEADYTSGKISKVYINVTIDSHRKRLENLEWTKSWFGNLIVDKITWENKRYLGEI